MASVLIIIATLTVVKCSPIANITYLEGIAPSFVSQPHGRGTSGIVTSAVLTLLLCVWTAIHPNIVLKDPTGLRAGKVRILYLLLALFAPEFVLAIAFQEWKDARDLCRLAYQIDAKKVVPEGPKKLNPLSSETVNGDRVTGPLEGIKEPSRPFDTETGRQEGEDVPVGPEIEEVVPEGPNKLNPLPSETVYGDPGTGPLDGIKEQSLLLGTETGRQKGEYVPVGPEIKEVPRIGRPLFPVRIWRRLGQWMRNHYSGLPTGAEACGEPCFTIECAFFAVMGGFTFSPLGAPDNDIRFDGTLTHRALKMLLEYDFISTDKFSTLKNEIKDKGKANTLAKLLACSQALWMLINCVCRKIGGLPISFIEINVMVHVVCALCMYLLWFKKPNDVRQPIPLTSKFNDPNVTAMLTSHTKFGHYFRFTVEETADVGTNGLEPGAPMHYADPEINRIMENKSSLLVLGGSDRNYLGRVGRADKEYSIKQSEKNDGVVMLLPGQTLVDSVGGFTLYDLRRPIHFTQIELTILRNAALGVRAHGHLEIVESHGRIWKTNDELLVDDEMDTLDRFQFGNSLYWTAIPLGVAYGGIHAIVWSDHFPTPVERQLWRASCIIIASPHICLCIRAIAWWILPLFTDPGSLYLKSATAELLEFLLPHFREEYWYDMGTSFLLTIFAGIVGGFIWVEIHPTSTSIRRTIEVLLAIEVALLVLSCISYRKALKARRIDNMFDISPDFWGAARYLYSRIIRLVWCVYVGARLYMIIEGFLSLRSCKNGIFETVAWANVWPHL